MTKKSADINYISKDLFPKTYNRTMIDDDYIKQLEQENKQLKEKVNKLEILIESLKLGVTLNQEQEDLLDEILFRKIEGSDE